MEADENQGTYLKIADNTKKILYYSCMANDTELKKLQEKINKLQKTIDDLNIKLSKHIEFIDSTYEGLKNPIEAARKWLRK